MISKVQAFGRHGDYQVYNQEEYKIKNALAGCTLYNFRGIDQKWELDTEIRWYSGNK